MPIRRQGHRTKKKMRVQNRFFGALRVPHILSKGVTRKKFRGLKWTKTHFPEGVITRAEDVRDKSYIFCRNDTPLAWRLLTDFVWKYSPAMPIDAAARKIENFGLQINFSVYNTTFFKIFNWALQRVDRSALIGRQARSGVARGRWNAPPPPEAGRKNALKIHKNASIKNFSPAPIGTAGAILLN